MLPFIVLVIAMALHIAEEAAAGWPRWARSITGLRIPGWKDFVVVNTIMLVLGTAGTLLRWEQPVFSLANAALVIINAIFFHILPSAVTRSYSPGLITSVILYIPAGGWLYIEAFRQGTGYYTLLYSILLGAFYMSVPPLVIFISAKKRRL